MKPLGMNLVFTGQLVRRLAAFERNLKLVGRLVAPPSFDLPPMFVPPVM